jgi:GalNAc5-diNAcBac-PP-undecaprenol beta-1,3-glucosyltransferase
MNERKISAKDPTADSQPLVSVVIPAHDRPALLLSAIQSAKNQTYRRFEIIVVDDCSTVDIEAVVRRHHSDVRMLRNPANMGAGYSRNAGIAHANGEIIAFLDDDDEWLPDKVKEQVEQLCEADACLCGFRVLETGKVRTHKARHITAHHLRQGNRFCGASGLAARRYVFDRIKFDDSILSGQDWDIYVQIVQQFNFVNVAKPLFVYRRGGPQSLSNRHESDPKILANRLAKLEKNRAFLGEFYYGVRVAGTYLRFVGNRRGKVRLVLLTMRRAGLVPTLYCLLQKLMNRTEATFTS